MQKHWSFWEWTFPSFFLSLSLSTFWEQEKSLHSFLCAFQFFLSLWTHKHNWNTKTHSENTHFRYWKENLRQEFFVAAEPFRNGSFFTFFFYIWPFYTNPSTLRWNVPFQQMKAIQRKIAKLYFSHIFHSYATIGRSFPCGEDHATELLNNFAEIVQIISWTFFEFVHFVLYSWPFFNVWFDGCTKYAKYPLYSKSKKEIQHYCIN